MALGDKITVVIDVVTNKATSGLKDFKSAVTEAQGFTGKLKAGVGSLKDAFASAATSPAGLTAGLAAAGTFAAEAVQQYVALGVQVADFAAATGLAAEDASRWAEVAGDVGIEVTALQSTIGKLNKTIEPELFDRLGVSIAHTADGAVDVNGTFLNVIDRLREIKDPAEQARVGAELLGRGWQSVAPLISRSAKDIKDQLDGVADTKVLDDDQLKQAQEFDAAMKDFQDTLEEVSLKLGQDLLPSLEKVAEAVGLFSDLGSFDIPLLDNINSLIGSTEQLWDLWFGDDDPVEYTGVLTDQLLSLGDGAAQSARYLGLLSQHTRESADSAADLTGKARLARAELKLLQDQIDGRKSFIDLQIALRTNAERLKQLADDYKAGKITAEQYYQDVASASLDSQASLADYISTVDEIPDTVKTEIIAEFDPLNPQKTWQDIQSYFDSHAIQVTTETDRENRRPNGGTPTTGGGTGGGGGLRPPGSGIDESVGGFGRGGGITVNVNGIVTNPTETGRQIADALRAYYRSGGEPV